MSAAVVQTSTCVTTTSGPASISHSLPSDATAGSAILVYVYGANWSGASGQHFTVSDGNAYTEVAKSGALADDKSQCAIFLFENHAGGPVTVTATPSTSCQRMGIVLQEVSGLASAASVEGITTASGTGTALDAGSLSVAGGAFIAQMSVANSGYTSISVGASFTSVGMTPTWTGVLGEYRIVASGGTYSTTSTLNTSSQWQAIGAAFKEAGGGGTPPGLATETDAALALAGKQIRAAGMATETDTALALVTLAGLPFNTAPYEFGQRTGLDVADFSIYASTALNVSVYAAADVLLASQLFSYTETTGADGRLTRKTHASLTAGSTYIFVAVTAGGAMVAAGRITAT